MGGSEGEGEGRGGREGWVTQHNTSLVDGLIILYTKAVRLTGNVIYYKLQIINTIIIIIQIIIQYFISIIIIIP